MDKSIIDDLARSGLSIEDLDVKPLGPSECAAMGLPTNTQGYVIPYYHANGERQAFYRARLFGAQDTRGKTVKYKQLRGSGNHVYFPKHFSKTLTLFVREQRKAGLKPYIILTEGEKKAACCVKAGLPCVALGGVNSWKNKTIMLPKATKLDNSHKRYISAKLPSDIDFLQEQCTLADGISTLVEAIKKYDLGLVIIYDTDSPEGMKPQVQRAAAMLGYEMVHLGLPVNNIKQVILPFDEKLGKAGLDDIIVHNKMSAENIKNEVDNIFKQRLGFPRHPNVHSYVNNSLQKTRMTRKEIQQISLSIIAELDARGRRLRSDTDNAPYYFDEDTHTLMSVNLLGSHGEALHESFFGNFMYKEFGIGAADSKLITWLASHYSGEGIVDDVAPKRLMALPPGSENELALQISDSHFIVVTGDARKPFEIVTNGSKGVLFEQGHVEGVDPKELEEEIDKQLNMELEPWWLDIFQNSVNLAGDDHVAKMMSMLYYISPFLLRWKGTQLPIELLIGEAGSGKSSLYELRLSVLTGRSKLRNIPNDLKDWFASVVNTGGLHVIDNVQFTNKDLRQRLSDEMCRLITEADPHIEMRKLYTTSAQAQLPVTSVFAMTAIQQPFYNADIIQRAAICELHAVNTGHDSDWVGTQLERFGGRVAWLAHHMVFLHKFLHEVTKGNWSNSYRAKHRLANYEQCLGLAMSVFGMDSEWLSTELSSRTYDKIREADWTLEAIRDYVEEHMKGNPKGIKFSAVEIADWAEAHEEHMKNPQLSNIRSLNRYISGHVNTIQAAIHATAKQDNHGKYIFSVGPKENS